MARRLNPGDLVTLTQYLNASSLIKIVDDLNMPMKHLTTFHRHDCALVLEEPVQFSVTGDTLFVKVLLNDVTGFVPFSHVKRCS